MSIFMKWTKKATLAWNMKTENCIFWAQITGKCKLKKKFEQSTFCLMQLLWTSEEEKTETWKRSWLHFFRQWHLHKQLNRIIFNGTWEINFWNKIVESPYNVIFQNVWPARASIETKLSQLIGCWFGKPF